ncbi:MAG: alkaline phosphatase [Ramlibacter sp.]|jgi:Ca2+-binding RTX toxin-like protein|nr:alkaline phosphatase [Ramlibacter sp.]
MTQYVLATVSGTTLSGFDPASDTLLIPSYLSPRLLTLAAVGADTVVSIGEFSVTLAGLEPGDLDGTQLIFGNGAFRNGGTGDDLLQGTVGDDVIDVTAGGADTVVAGYGNDIIRVAGALAAGDAIDGGEGSFDELWISGEYATPLALDGAMVQGIERFVLGTGGTIRLQLDDTFFAAASGKVTFDATAQFSTDAVHIDGSGVDTGFDAETGAGADTLVGGDEADWLHGRSGANLLVGGAGGDALQTSGSGNSTLLGGAGGDLLQVVEGTGSNVLYGGSGSDTLNGSNGADTLHAAGAEDAVNDLVVDGDTTSNRLNGYGGHDVLEGSDGADELYGGTGNDTLRGGAGNDTLDGGAGTDSMEGGAGNDHYIVRDTEDVVSEAGGGGFDTLISYAASYTLGEGVENARIDPEWTALAAYLAGNTQANQLNGGVGNDTLVGNDGNDTLLGERGADSLEGGLGDDVYTLWGGDTVVELADGGIDTVMVWDASWVLPDHVENAEIESIGGTLTGNALDNHLVSNGGGTTVTGGLGNDTLEGGGLDRLRGGAGNDTYIVIGNGFVEESAAASGGVDHLITDQKWTLGTGIENLTLTGDAFEGTGNALDNVLRGSAAANSLDGWLGADTMIGGGGDDSYRVDDEGDVVTEIASGGDRDLVYSRLSHTLAANVEWLILEGEQDVRLDGTGNALDNRLQGHWGTNVLDGGIGADTMLGDTGDDTYVVNDAGDVVIEELFEGRDTVRSSLNLTLGDHLEVLVLTGAATQGIGNAEDNELRGNGAANRLEGLDGQDTLNGGSGADTLVGGLGDDTYLVDSAADVIVEAAGADGGTDRVVAAVSFTLGARQENLSLGGTANLNGTGNALRNELLGNGGNNRLDGGAGADRMIGGNGNDTYVVDHRLDEAVESRAAGGVDTVLSSVTFTLREHVDNLTLTGTARINGTGNMLANVLVGNAAANRLDGGAGADTLRGGLGNDTYMVEAGDVVVEAEDGGIDTLVSGATRTLGAWQENLTLTGIFNVDGTGNAMANVLRGNEGDNKLDGRGGADRMDGGYGADVYVVDHDGDIASEKVWDAWVDTVVSSVDHAMGNSIDDLVLTGTAIRGIGNLGNNAMAGNARDNLLDGAASNDTLVGGGGNDTLVGGTHADDLRGDAGSDVFVFRSTDESNLAAYDLILDFTRGTDRIDLSLIDGNAGLAGLQSLRFVGSQPGSAAGDMWYETVEGGIALFANTDSDAAVEFVVVLAGVTALDAGDFML